MEVILYIMALVFHAIILYIIFDCYNTKEEAIAHVKYQKEKMHSTKNWHVQYIKVEFKEYLTF